MKAIVEAAEHDARAMLALSKSISDQLGLLKALGMPERVATSIENAHAEVLRTSHLVTSWVALVRNSERK